MKLLFELTMPGCPSWNGKWSGDGKFYGRVIPLNKKGQENAAAIIANSPYTHRWDDGWMALISVKEVSSSEAAKLKKKSNGFCSYDWMIKNILSHGSCYDKKEIKETQTA